MLCVTRADQQKHRIPLATWLKEGITGHDQDQGEWTRDMQYGGKVRINRQTFLLKYLRENNISLCLVMTMKMILLGERRKAFTSHRWQMLETRLEIKLVSPHFFSNTEDQEKTNSRVVYSSQNRNTWTCHQVRQTLQDYFSVHKMKLIIWTQDVPQGKHELFPNENSTYHSHI